MEILGKQLQENTAKMIFDTEKQWGSVAGTPNKAVLGLAIASILLVLAKELKATTDAEKKGEQNGNQEALGSNRIAHGMSFAALCAPPHGSDGPIVSITHSRV